MMQMADYTYMTSSEQKKKRVARFSDNTYGRKTRSFSYHNSNVEFCQEMD